jgi:hypothetical protein
MQDILDCRPQVPNVPLGSPGATKGKQWDIVISTEKLEKITGKAAKDIFRSLPETVHDTVQNLRDRGLLPEAQA